MSNRTFATLACGALFVTNFGLYMLAPALTATKTEYLTAYQIFYAAFLVIVAMPKEGAK